VKGSGKPATVNTKSNNIHYMTMLRRKFYQDER